MENLICGRCKQSKPLDEFTTLNRSKNGSRGLCKKCKKQRDAASREKRDQMRGELPYFAITPDIIQKPIMRPRIGVMVLEKIADRENTKSFFDLKNFGLCAILSELDEPWEYTRPELINVYEFVLVSLTSVMDVENLIYTFECFTPKPVKPKIIIGGFGVINIKLMLPYIDIAVFGRAEGQINEILAGEEFDNVWRKERDPDLEGKYIIRAPRYLVLGENGIGCRGRCKFCQYTWTRPALQRNQKYNPGQSLYIQETDWAGLEITKAGRYTTAWDGWSEETRLRVSKPITDQSIRDKLLSIGNLEGIDATINIKVFQIIGYPWETIESVKEGINCTAELLRQIDEAIANKIILAFLCTPFGPEPMTPMQYEQGNIEVNWREELNGIDVYRGKHIDAFITPVIPGPYTLTKRIMINRAEMNDLGAFKLIAFSSRLKRLPERYKVPWMLKHGIIGREMFDKINRAGFDYLSVEFFGTREFSDN
jgi:hypothetical protein